MSLASAASTDAPAITQAAQGVERIRLPLPWALDHVNAYLIEDGPDHAVLVDAGIASDDHRALIEKGLNARRLSAVICTHMHPDHSGLAGDLCNDHDAPLHMTRTDYFAHRVLQADTAPPPPVWYAFYKRAGWEAEWIDASAQRFGLFGQMTRPLPDSYLRLRSDQRLTIGDESWRVFIGSGHAPEHACLIREEDGLVLCGDQVLPGISPNISVYPTEPEADPITDWLHALRRFDDEIDEGALALPGHGEPFKDPGARARQIIDRHEKALSRLFDHLSEPRRAIDCFPALFRRTIDEGQRGLATGEATAHLNHLLVRGLIERRSDENGVYWYAQLS